MGSRLVQAVTCLLLLAPTAAVQAAIPQSERDALIALYAATGGDGWIDNTGWNGAPGTECSWYGITCDGAQTTVTWIELSGNQLTGVLPPELGSLTSLQELNLSDNQLSGPLPQQLGDLTSLTGLNLAVNQLSGPLPQELGNLTSLTSLHLGINQLSGSLPQELGNLTSLTNLLIFTNQLSGPIPAALGALPLQILWASGNQLSGPLPPELANLTSISSLLLGHNALYAVDSAAQGWADTYDSDWEATQTVTPANLNAPPVSSDDATISWTPIIFSALAGGYEIELASSPAGPWSLATTTPSKTESSAIVGGLTPGEWYFRARTFTEPHTSNQNTVYSGYGSVVSTIVVIDGDGVDNAIEDAGPNGGDGNDDAIPDSAQPNVATFPAANGNGYITLISTCELRDVVAVLKDSLPPAPTLFPYALVEFRLPCANAEMTVLYHAGESWNAETGYWKYGPETPGQALTTKWYELSGVTFDTTTVDGATVARAQFTLTDGQLGDDTGIDGQIVDQGGPGIPAPAASIPTASTWTLLLLAALLGTVGVLKLH